MPNTVDDTRIEGYRRRLDDLDKTIAAAMERWNIPLLRVSIAVVFVWFGALKIGK